MIGNRIRALREDNDLTQSDIAKLLNTTFQMYYRYEKEKVDLPVKHLITLCQYYNVSADYILGFTKEQKRIHL